MRIGTQKKKGLVGKLSTLKKYTYSMSSYSLVAQRIKNLPAMRRPGFPGWGRAPGEGNGNPLQDSCLENSMARGAWRATVHGIAKSQQD